MCVVSHDYKNYTPITYNITGNKKGLFQENWAKVGRLRILFIQLKKCQICFSQQQKLIKSGPA